MGPSIPCLRWLLLSYQTSYSSIGDGKTRPPTTDQKSSRQAILETCEETESRIQAMLDTCVDLHYGEPDALAPPHAGDYPRRCADLVHDICQRSARVHQLLTDPFLVPLVIVSPLLTLTSHVASPGNRSAREKRERTSRSAST